MRYAAIAAISWVAVAAFAVVLLHGSRTGAADADAATVQPAEVGNLAYQAKHAAWSDDNDGHWWPAHTNGAAPTEETGRHARTPGVRPDLRIERTWEIPADQIQAILAGGAE
ncbi:hypothetical protein Drose_06525 [Dactylosporangium roseum]|uniref:Secreted protein n=1 Tax=Dactylosporangium roseum TaxID=47989 RepID=A0ABY5Z787_9ACTN|nr:hypothetical protein [Dactylosporangium roseum]UWZ37928.1 hypothetical protein Drose_06525 [Dactylosporangium roseum]